MRKIRKSKLYIGLCTAISILLFVSSCNQEAFLENENKANLTDQTQWASEKNADIFLNDILTTTISATITPLLTGVRVYV